MDMKKDAIYYFMDYGEKNTLKVLERVIARLKKVI
jgi:hypothetical protein